MNIIKSCIYLLVCGLLLSACDDSLSGSIKLYSTTVEIQMPDQLPQGTLSSETYDFKNITSGMVYAFDSPDVQLMQGIYDVSYNATLTAENGNIYSLRAFKSSVVITEDNGRLRMAASYVIATDDLIISEVFFAGTLQPSGNSYTGDDYVKLYNNTDHIIYADGLTLFESKFTTTEKNVYTPDLMSEAMTVQALYTIPGSGRDHPVRPGEFLLLADTGIDHRVANPNSFDLSHADFEWYDVSSSPSNLDIDSPTVLNLDKWYCYTRTYWMLHNRGYKAYGIARIPVDRDTYLADYLYSYDYEVVTAAGTFPMSAQAYKIPNDWIVDVVNCSVASDYAWCVCAPALDCGWTSCGTISNDKTRFFKSVRRKLLYIDPSGRAVYKDTNNSTEDFNPSVVPSEIELQGSVTDPDGNRSSIITFDGLTPQTDLQ